MPARPLSANVGLLRVAILCVLLALAIIALPANAAPAATVEAAAQEIVELPTSSGSTLQTRVLRPPGLGPFPLAIVSHGSPADAAQRPSMEIPTFPPVFPRSYRGAARSYSLDRLVGWRLGIARGCE